MRKNSGFTLLEMLIVVAIIGILVAVAIPAFNSQLDKTRETACNANRRSLYMVVTVNYMTDEYPSLSSAFTSIYSLNGAEYKCPSEGTYSWVDDAEGAGHIVCSVHGDGSGPGSGGDPGDPGDPGGEEPLPDYYPGTTITLQPSYWPQQSDFETNWSTITVSAGGGFRYTDGNYYIVTRDVTVSKSQAASGPGGDVYNWYSTQRITGRIVTYSSPSEQKSTLTRGDICQEGSDYYVFVDGGSYAYGPTSPNGTPSQWYKIP